MKASIVHATSDLELQSKLPSRHLCQETGHVDVFTCASSEKALFGKGESAEVGFNEKSVVFGSILLIHFPLNTLLQCIAKMVIFIMSQFQPGLTL